MFSYWLGWFYSTFTLSRVCLLTVAAAASNVTILPSTRLNSLVIKRDVALCSGQHGAVCLPGGGQRGICGRRFKTQPATMLERRTRLEHTAAELGGHGCREQVGLKARSCTVDRLYSYYMYPFVFLPPQRCCCRGQPGQDAVSVLLLWSTSASSHPAGHACVGSPLLLTLRHGSDCWSDAVGLVGVLAFSPGKCHLVASSKLQNEASSLDFAQQITHFIKTFQFLTYL